MPWVVWIKDPKDRKVVEKILTVTLDAKKWGASRDGFIKSNEIKKEIIMVTSIILANVERSKINETAEQLAAIDGISEVYSVSGNYDLIAVVRVQSNEELSDLVTKKLLKINSILKTETMLAFKAYSRHDLDAIFSIGTQDR